MPSYGRHRVYCVFWTWSVGPFVCTTDIHSASGSKGVGSTGGCKITLFPRAVPRVVRDRESGQGRVQRTPRGYMDVLRPNDWVFVFVDPFDGDDQDPLFMGLIDDVRMAVQVGPNGARQMAVHVSCSSWEKAISTTSCLSNLYVSQYINIANLYDIAITTSDSEFTPTVPGIISAIMKTFLRAESSEEFLQRQANEFRTREQQAVREVDRLQWLLAGVEEDVPTRDPTAINDPEQHNYDNDPVRAIMGQFELPGTRIPLWGLIKLRFENIRERTFTIPSTMTNMLGSPLSRFIDEWSNNIINEMIYDVRRISADGTAHLETGGRELASEAVIHEGYLVRNLEAVVNSASQVSDSVGQLFRDIAPYAILMKRPLFPNELEDLEGPTFDLKDLTSLDLGFSDSDHYNMSWLEAAALDANQQRAATGLSGFDFNRERSIEMVRRHGLRIYNDKVQTWPDSTEEGEPVAVPVPSRELFREWNDRIQRAGLDQIELLTGSAAIPKYVRGAYIGGKLEVTMDPEPGLFSAGSRRLFYLESMDWSYQAQNGAFQTSFGLTRGYEMNSQLMNISVR